MGELFLYLYVIGALATGTLTAVVYLKVFFAEDQRNPSILGWLFTCAAMCPFHAIVWPFVIKGLLHTLKNYDTELRRQKEQKQYQEWVMGLQDSDDYPAPPWIDPKRFDPEFVKKWGVHYKKNPDTSSTHDAQSRITQENTARLTSEEIRRGSFQKRYATARALAQQHKTTQENKRIKDNKNAIEVDPKLSPIRTNFATEAGRLSADGISPKNMKRETFKARHTDVQTAIDKPEELKPFTASVVCHVCREVLIVDTLEREASCPNCRQRLVVH